VIEIFIGFGSKMAKINDAENSFSVGVYIQS